MKKALIIANMLFASAAVWGMNQQIVQTKEISGVTQYENMMDLSIKKDMCQKLFNKVQSKLDEIDLISKDTKLLYHKLKFEDVWEQIECIFFPNSSNANNPKNISNNLETSFKQMVRGPVLRDILYKFYSTEEIGKRKAKFFYKQVLGNSELGKDLYEKAVKTIDSAEYVQCSDRVSTFCSITEWFTDKVRCFYHEENDLVGTLIHETGHILDAHYRRIKKFGQAITSKFETWQVFQNKYVAQYAVRYIYPRNNQAENVSIFFESLLRTDLFREKLIKDGSMGYRILEIFIDSVRKSLIHELMASYNKDQLNNLILKGPHSQDYEKMIISELKKHDKIKSYIDSLRELDKVLYPEYNPLSEDEENLWRNLLQKLESQGYTELHQLFCDIDKGESELRSFSYDSDSVISEFTFEKGSEEIREPLPKLYGIDWEKINWFAKKRSFYVKAYAYFYESLGYAYYLKQKRGETLPIDNHAIGAYNAFNMVKKLKGRNSMSIEEILAELTKPFKPLDITDESAEEFMEFLKR